MKKRTSPIGSLSSGPVIKIREVSCKMVYEQLSPSSPLCERVCLRLLDERTRPVESSGLSPIMIIINVCCKLGCGQLSPTSLMAHYPKITCGQIISSPFTAKIHGTELSSNGDGRRQTERSGDRDGCGCRFHLFLCTSNLYPLN